MFYLSLKLRRPLSEITTIEGIAACGTLSEYVWLYFIVNIFYFPV